ncbi:MAG: zinc metallopeptidase [Acidobacteriales bacterium]|nr:zinc metallopeptidase [Terriglobales bacterium]
MRWSPLGRSRNLEDRRGGGSFGLPIGGRGLGIGGVLLLLVLSVIFKRDFLSLIYTGTESATTQGQPVQDSSEEPMVQFVSFVLDDAQNTWATLFRNQGKQYREAKLVLFRDVVQSACGFAQSVSGPFYCPADSRVYIDLGFYDELKNRFGASGDFAQAYVLAHEIGHHVQNVLGIDDQVRAAQQRDSGSRNELSVRMELQADCLAGVWGHSAAQRNVLEPGDVEEGLRAAAAIGDDRLQRMAGRSVSPESFTHGTSEQRSQWLRRGIESGSLESCNTFSQ